ncbi:hypothetical protein ACOMHN_037493 [Nucella lapillus]
MVAIRYFSCFATVVVVVSIIAFPSGVSSTRNFDRSFLRKIFKCPACHLENCPIPEGFPGCELVREPGVCACCLVCARQAGELCGLTRGRCSKDLTCRPMADDPDPLGAILAGNAVCM